MTRPASLTRRSLVAAVATAVVATLAPSTPASAADRPFSYQVTPGSAQWRALGSHQEMVDATQMPDKTAVQLRTPLLVDAVLAYPLLPDALAFNSVQQGFETVTARFTGLQELLRRPDAGQELLKRYRTLNVAARSGESLGEAGDRALTAWKLETILAQPQVLATLTAAQSEALLRVGLAVHRAKQTDAATYGQAGLEPTAVLLGRTLALRENWDWSGSELLREGVQLRPGAVETTIAAVRAHLADPSVAHPVGDDVGTLDYYSTVYTPNGSAVTVITMTSELTSAQIASYNSYVATNYPSASRERNASRKYNCHSYAWYSTSTANDRWMNSPGDDQYWLDGSYTRWQIPYIWFSNMKLSYASDDHSGIWVGTGSYVRSKWGQLGLMYHFWNYSPYSSATTNSYFPS
ncbi:hypothetical protein [Micromonospora sp. NBC_01813]|uniref:hypothetical protein n=1 Tax=Micromonospora sp. NBC_01813 TaxID=2975988 RepID=UPI002DD82798|nr:hypothetical protein [Micromonospora sp. NBC_01813]WSA07375.1 hypothetical protein OG958_24430 [Micromonospora sp. NBC_01813]